MAAVSVDKCDVSDAWCSVSQELTWVVVSMGKVACLFLTELNRSEEHTSELQSQR